MNRLTLVLSCAMLVPTSRAMGAAGVNHPSGFVTPKPAAVVELWPGTPPTWIASARDDKTASFSFAAAIGQKLKGLGVEEELFAVDTGDHSAFHYGVASGPGAAWPEPMIRWLRRVGMAEPH